MERRNKHEKKRYWKFTRKHADEKLLKYISNYWIFITCFYHLSDKSLFVIELIAVICWSRNTDDIIMKIIFTAIFTQMHTRLQLFSQCWISLKINLTFNYNSSAYQKSVSWYIFWCGRYFWSLTNKKIKNRIFCRQLKNTI
jgi:hypothetical protein